VWQIFRTREDAHFITPRFIAKTTVPDEVAHCAFTMVFSGRPHAETLAVHVRAQLKVSCKAHSVRPGDDHQTDLRSGKNEILV
jgi:hypothetical protein